MASDDLVKIWNAATYECVHEIRSCESYFRAFFKAAFSPDGRSLAAVNRATIHL
ncbi:MAG: hypothetical protein U0872_00465 [Planctomycetaceae bacterium]